MIPQHYPIEPGVLYGGEYPGDKMLDVALARLRGLVELGVRTFIDLTSPFDHMAPYHGLLANLQTETSITLRRISMPVPDMGVPDSDETMRAIMSAIRNSMNTAPAVYVHCWGGIGRTGTVAGCWLRECGLDPDTALARVQHLYSTHMAKATRHPESPQTPGQKDYIRSWQPAR